MGPLVGTLTGPWSLVAWYEPMVPWITSVAGGIAAGENLVAFVSASGWLIVVWGIRLLFTGRLITGREADERDARYEKKVAECEQLRTTLAGFVDAIETSNAMIAAVMEEARAEVEDRAPAAPPRRRTIREGTGGQGAT